MNIVLLELANFQKHSKLNLEFTDGVNIIYGGSDKGKSCVRRAIEWVLFNQKIDGVRKAGTKQTSVRITLQNGTIIERIRSASINRYTLIVDGKELTFDAIGKTIPEEIQNAIGIAPIQIEDEELYLNSAPQLALPFLFDKSPTFRMKLFNKLTGNDLLDKLFVQLNKDILGINREAKQCVENAPLLEKNVQAKEEEKEILEAKFSRAKELVENLKVLDLRYSKLLELQGLYEFNCREVALTEMFIKSKVVPEPTAIQELANNITFFEHLSTLQNALEQTIPALDKVSSALKIVTVPALNCEGLAESITRLQYLQTMYEKASAIQSREGDLTKDKTCGILEVERLENNFKSLLKEAKICPLCLTEMTDQHVEGLKI